MEKEDNESNSAEWRKNNLSISMSRLEDRTPDIIEQLRKENTTLRQRLQELAGYVEHKRECEIRTHGTYTCNCGLLDLLTTKH